MDRKCKVFSLIALSGAMLFSFAIVGKNFDFSRLRALDSETIVNDAIDFDGSKISVSEVDGNYVSRSKTKQGDYVYLINKSLDTAKPSTGSVATFVKSSESGDFVSSIEFARDSHNSDAYIFQNVYQIDVVTGSSISNIHLEISDDGENYRQYRTFNSDHYEESSGSFYYTGSVSIDSEGEDCSFRLVQDVESKGGLNQNFKRIVLSYTCNNNYTPLPKYTVSANNSEHGSIALGDRTIYKSGQTVSFEVNPEQGYEVESLTLNPSVQYTRNENIYSFVMPSSDVQISAVFGAIEYEVTAAESDFGSISLDETGYNAGETVEFMVFPAEGYEIVNVSTNPALSINENDSLYSFVMPYSDVEISATYKEIKYSVSSSCEHGAISLDKTEYAPDDTVEFEITTDPGYEVDEVTLSTGGEVIEVDGIYMFEMPSEDVVVIVSFNEVTPVYRVSVSGNEHCTVDYDDIDYDEGDEVIFTIDDIEQYYVLENVQTLPACTITEADGFYSFDMPSSNVQIIVTLGEYHNLSLDNIENGSIDLISPLQEGAVRVGSTIQFEVIPDEMYEIDDVTATPFVSFNIIDNIYSFVMPQSDIELSATFKEETPSVHNITAATSLEHGSVATLYAYKTALGGTTAYINIKPDSGYQTKSVYIVGHPGVGNFFFDSGVKWGFTMPNYDITVAAEFEAIPRTLSSITLTGQKVSFTVGDDFNVGDLIVTASYANGDKAAVTGYTVDATEVDMDTAGSYDVTVSYTEGGITKSQEYGISVMGSDVTSTVYAGDNGLGNYSYELTINSDGTGVYVLTRVKSGVTTTFNQYFTWTDAGSGKINIVKDTNMTSTFCTYDNYNLWFYWSGDVANSNKNTITISGNTATFGGWSSTGGGSQKTLTLTIVE